MTRQTAVRKHDDGLVEVVSETDAKEDMRFFVTETGRVTHARMTDEGKDLLGEDFVGRLSLLGEGIFQRLERNHPVDFRIPLGRLLGPDATTKLPGADKFTLDGTLEYLGHTTFNEVRAAGYRTRFEGRLRVETAQMSFGGDGISYFDASSGLQLHTRMSFRVAISIPGQRSETFHGDCQYTLDRSGSSGL